MKTPCLECGNPIEYAEIMGYPNLKPSLCDTCSAQAKKEASQQSKLEIEKERELHWLKICPPVFRETDRDRLCATLQMAARRYVGQWVSLVGTAGSGKTRTAYLLLEAAMREGLSVYALTAGELARYSGQQWSDDKIILARSTEAIRRCYKSDVLLIDDIGKARMTERAESEFFDLLDYRHRNKKPIIWTANSAGIGLSLAFGEERREAILRRLTEFARFVDTAD